MWKYWGKCRRNVAKPFTGQNEFKSWKWIMILKIPETFSTRWSNEKKMVNIICIFFLLEGESWVEGERKPIFEKKLTDQIRSEQIWNQTQRSRGNKWVEIWVGNTPTNTPPPDAQTRRKASGEGRGQHRRAMLERGNKNHVKKCPRKWNRRRAGWKQIPSFSWNFSRLKKRIIFMMHKKRSYIIILKIHSTTTRYATILYNAIQCVAMQHTRL